MDMLNDLSPDIDVTHLNYSPAKINPRHHALGEYKYDGPIVIKDILLQKSP